MIRTRKYRLYPKGWQKILLENTLESCRQLYNSALEERKCAYKMRGVTIHLNHQLRELTECRACFPEMSQINRRTQHDALLRLDRAFQGFFRRIKAGRKAGYPRFKSKNRYNTFTYNGDFDVYERGVRLSKIGGIRTRPSIEEKFSNVCLCHIVCENDKWYVIMACKFSDVEKKSINRDSVIGIDLGTDSFITLSNGEKVENPKFFEHAQKLLKLRQQRLSRRKKGSKRRVKARVLVAKTHQKIRQQRYDFHHKISRQLIDKYDVIGYEDLRIDKMTKDSYFAKSINDAGWRDFINMLAYKAEDTGKWAVPVNPAYTSQICSECKSMNSLQVSDKIYICKDCGLVKDRDTNAAVNILQKAMGTIARGEGFFELDEARSG